MRITFIDPPNWDGKGSVERVFGCNYTYYPFPNIFTLTTAAYLEKQGHVVRYMDSANEGWARKEFIQYLREDDSDFFCIRTVNLSKALDLKAAELIRKIKPESFIIFEGPAPTYWPEAFADHEKHFAVRGESESTLSDLLECFSKNSLDFSGVQGLSYYHRGQIRHNPSREIQNDLDALPYPARHLLNRDLYFNPKLSQKPWTCVLASRGCPSRCIYCVPCTLSFARELEYKKTHTGKPPVRKRSPENVIEEIRLLKIQGYRAFSFIDDQFIWDRHHTLEICRGIADLNMEWGCASRADYISDEIVRGMAEAGCRYIDLGVESFHQDVLDYIKKGLKVETIYKAIDIIKKYKISVKLNLLMGMAPFETREMVLQNIDMARKLKPGSVMFSIVSPFPGTEFYEIAKSQGWFDDGEYRPIYLQKRGDISLPGLSSEELEKLIRKANYKLFFNKDFIFQHIKRIRSFRGLKDGLKALYRKLCL